MDREKQFVILPIIDILAVAYFCFTVVRFRDLLSFLPRFRDFEIFLPRFRDFLFSLRRFRDLSPYISPSLIVLFAYINCTCSVIWPQNLPMFAQGILADSLGIYFIYHKEQQFLNVTCLLLSIGTVLTIHNYNVVHTPMSHKSVCRFSSAKQTRTITGLRIPKK